MQGEGEEYDQAINAVWEQVKKLSNISTPPGKLSLATQVEAAEAACGELKLDTYKYFKEIYKNEK